MKSFHYKGFIGSIEASPEDKCLYGKLLYITDLVTYEAQTVGILEKEFKNAVEEYLKTCETLGKAPMKPFKGSLNVRIGPMLHKEVALHATMQGMTLNDYIKEAVKNQIQREEGLITTGLADKFTKTTRFDSQGRTKN